MLRQYLLVRLLMQQILMLRWPRYLSTLFIKKMVSEDSILLEPKQIMPPSICLKREQTSTA